jgi:hypothetical protein
VQIVGSDHLPAGRISEADVAVDAKSVQTGNHLSPDVKEDDRVAMPTTKSRLVNDSVTVE